MAVTYNQPSYERLSAFYAVQRAQYVSHKSMVDSGIEWLTGDSRLKIVDKDIEQARALASAGDWKGAIILVSAAIDTLGYVATLPSYFTEVKDEAAADIAAIQDAAGAAWSSTTKALIGVGVVAGIVLLAVVIVKSK